MSYVCPFSFYRKKHHALSETWATHCFSLCWTKELFNLMRETRQRVVSERPLNALSIAGTVDMGGSVERTLLLVLQSGMVLPCFAYCLTQHADMR